MKTMKFCLLLLLAAGFGPGYRPAAAEEHARSSPNLELARQLNQAFVEVAEEVSPVVVVITVTQKSSPALKLPSGSDESDGEDPLDRFPPEFLCWRGTIFILCRRAHPVSFALSSVPLSKV